MFFLNYFKNQNDINTFKSSNRNSANFHFEIFNDNNDNKYNNSEEDIGEKEISKSNITLPNYILIKIINYLLVSNFDEIITLQYESDLEGTFNNFLKLSLISKSVEQYVIPNLNFPYIKLKTSYDCKTLNRWLTKGVFMTPLIGIKNIDIEFPNIVSAESIVEYSNLAKIKNGFDFEKVHFSNSLAFTEVNEIQDYLTTFVKNHNFKQIEFSVIPSIKTPLIQNLVPMIKLSDITICKNLQHISLKNQLLSCERVLSFVIELFPQLLSLDLTNNRIGVDYSEVFHETLSSAVNLQSLKLGSNVLKENIIFILPIIQESSSLKYLDISENYINENSSRVISDYIENNKHLEYLNLSRNLFDQISINSIMMSLPTNKTITHLELSELKSFSPTLLNDLIETTTTLKTLEISSNKLEYPSAFFNSLKRNNSIKSLNLSYCSIQPKDYKSLSEYLNSDQCNLAKLSLLKVFPDSIPTELLFNQICNINELDISINYMNEDDCKCFSNFLKTNSSITKLNLKRNKIGQNVQYLFNALESNSTLTHLDLSGNVLDMNSIDYNFISKNKTLVSLNLSHNVIRNYEMEELIYYIQQSSSITHLNISMNKESGDAKFQKRKNSKIHEIRASSIMKNNSSLKKIARVLIYENDPHFQYTTYIHSETLDQIYHKKSVKRVAY